MKRTFCIAVFLLLACVTVFGQTSYKGLTPDKSTKADVERVFGRPVKNVSKTLIEYNGTADANKIYIQYDDETATAGVFRIELFCEAGSGAKDPRYGCKEVYDRLVPGHHSIKTPQVTRQSSRASLMRNGVSTTPVTMGRRPSSSIASGRNVTGESLAHWRIGLYSRELYENAVPKSCTGTFAGVWETNRGQMTITRTSEYPHPGYIKFKGSYSSNGTISGETIFYDSLDGEWRDSTGRGTMSLKFNDELYSVYRGNSFTGTWERTSGKGPKQGKWEGRGVETKGGTN